MSGVARRVLAGKLTYSATGLPDGLSIDPQTGTISGTPSSLARMVEITVTADSGYPPGSWRERLALWWFRKRHRVI